MKIKIEKNNFGKILAGIRKSKGFTQITLAKAVGVSHRVIAYYEAETNYPPTHLLIPIADTLKVSIDELMGREKPERPTPNNIVFWKKLLTAENLSPKDRRALLHYLDALTSKKNNNK